MKNNYVASLMIIDDNEGDRYLLTRSLSSIDYKGEILEAENGQQALNLLMSPDQNKAFPPVVIFLDINMPIMDGYEFLEEFSKLKLSDDRYKSVIVMMLSGSDNPSDIDKSMKHNDVKNYLIKGRFEQDTLKQLISV